MFSQGPKHDEVHALAADPRFERLLNRVGKARSPLSPGGLIEVDGEVIDAISNRKFIEAESRVRVIDVEGNRAVVRLEFETNTDTDIQES